MVHNVHERTFRIVYDNHNSSFSELLMIKMEPIIHQQNVDVFMKKFYKFKNDLSPPLINDMFQVPKTNDNLKSFQNIANDKKN